MVELLVIVLILVALVDVHVLDVLPLPLFFVSNGLPPSGALGGWETRELATGNWRTYATVDGIPELVRRRVKGTMQVSSRQQSIQATKRVRQPQGDPITYISNAKAPVKIVLRKTAFLRMRDL